MTTLFGSVISAMVTPFNERGNVNYKVAAEMVHYLADNGSSGVVVAGTTGESPTLSCEEKLKLFRVVADAVKGKIKVIAGTGGNSTADTKDLTEQASKTGVDGVMLVTPYYNKPTQEGLYKHFAAVAAVTDLPVMLYNVPGRTGVNMKAETTLRLAKLANVAAVKEASGDLEQAAQIIHNAPEDFSVYSGDDAFTLPMLSIGAVGVVSVASNVAGLKIAEMVAEFMQGDCQEAARMHRELLPLFQGLFMSTNPIPVKASLQLMGFKVGSPRLPLLPMDEEKVRKLEDILRGYGLTI